MPSPGEGPVGCFPPGAVKSSHKLTYLSLPHAFDVCRCGLGLLDVWLKLLSKVEEISKRMLERTNEVGSLVEDLNTSAKVSLRAIPFGSEYAAASLAWNRRGGSVPLVKPD
jgi:hypothetical protein